MPPSFPDHTRSPFRLITFGGASLIDAAGAVALDQRRRLALLALIAVGRSKGVSRDTLVAYLSPESTTASARHALHQLLYYLRQQTDDAILLGTDRLRLNPAVVTADVADFEDALDAGDRARAVSLYTGPFLEGLHLGGSGPFEEWVAGERARLAGRCGDALIELARAADDAAHAEAAVLAWRKLTVFDPLSGRAAVGLMRALAARGDRESAIRHARMHGQLVRAELDADPDAEVLQLAAELRRSALQPRPSPAPVAEPAVVAAAEPAGDAPPRQAVALSPPRARTWRKKPVAAAVVGGLLMLALAAVIAPDRRQLPAAAASPLVAVLPFRIAPGDSGLAWLREGMVELLTIRLAGDGGVGVVAPALVLSGWRREAAAGELPADRLADLAAGLGATRVIEGSVVGSGERVTLTAAIVALPDESTVARATAEGARDSIPVLVDRVAAQLLGVSSGIGSDRLASLTSASFPAIQAFLAGRAAMRRGNAEEGVRRFRDAVAIDTTFALAGFELLRAGYWGGMRADNELGARRAREGLARLSAADRALLPAMIGQFPDAPEMFRTWNAAVTAYPQRPDAWYGLGKAYFHWGALAGFPDFLERAESAFRRGVALDSAEAEALAASPRIAEPISHLVELAQIRGDTAEVRRLALQVLAADSTTPLAATVRWHLALTDGPDALAAFRQRAEGLAQPTLMAIALFITWTGIGEADYPAAARADISHLKTHDPGWAGFALTSYALNQGRPENAPPGSELLGYPARERIRGRVREALWWDTDTASALEAAVVLRRHAEALPADGPALRAQYQDLCTLMLWRAAQGDHGGLPAAAARLRSAPMTGGSTADSASLNYPRLCAALLEATYAAAIASPHAPRLLHDADSVAREFIFQICCGESVPEANLVLARLWEARGDAPRALAAVRRRSGGFRLRPNFLTTFLREEGRLAALTGDTAGAVRAYRHYLMLRYDPAPALRPEAERVRRALSALRQRPTVPRDPSERQTRISDARTRSSGGMNTAR